MAFISIYDLLSDISFMFSVQTNVDKDQVKAAIKAQQDQQIDNVNIFFVQTILSKIFQFICG